MYVKTQINVERSSFKQNLIAGVTTQLGIPVSRKVRAYMRSTGVLIGSVVSDMSGQYKMYLPESLAYTIVSIDPDKHFNAVIQDNVVPK